MNEYTSSIVFPYELHVYSGPMKSGKSRTLFHLIDTFSYLEDVLILQLKPDLDTREFDSRSSVTKLSGIEFKKIPFSNPKVIEEFFEDELYTIVIIDECHFFSQEIVGVIDRLLKRGVYVICAGLDLDFRGEVFGSMGEILARANVVHKLGGVCDFKGCNRKAIRTQREINGEPAHYDSPIILVGDEEEGYSCRCLEHHFVKRDSLDKFI